MADVEHELAEIKRELATIRREMPGMGSIGCGVALGIILSSILVAIAGAIFWAAVIGGAAASAR